MKNEIQKQLHEEEIEKLGTSTLNQRKRDMFQMGKIKQQTQFVYNSTEQNRLHYTN